MKNTNLAWQLVKQTIISGLASLPQHHSFRLTYTESHLLLDTSNYEYKFRLNGKGDHVEILIVNKTSYKKANLLTKVTEFTSFPDMFNNVKALMTFANATERAFTFACPEHEHEFGEVKLIGSKEKIEYMINILYSNCENRVRMFISDVSGTIVDCSKSYPLAVVSKQWLFIEAGYMFKELYGIDTGKEETEQVEAEEEQEEVVVASLAEDIVESISDSEFLEPEEFEGSDIENLEEE